MSYPTHDATDPVKESNIALKLRLIYLPMFFPGKAKHVITIILLLVSQINLIGQDINLMTPDVYNCNFDRPLDSSDWHVEHHGHAYYEIDTTDKYSGTGSIFVSTKDDSTAYFKVSQRFLLPQSSGLVSINLHSKGISHNTLLKIYAIGKNGNREGEDSVYMAGTEHWTPARLNLGKSQSRMMAIEIVVPGNNTVWLDDLHIKIDGVDVDQIPVQEIQPGKRSSETLRKYILSGELSKSSHPFSVLKKAKIVGIGESLHASHEMAIWRNEIIRHLIEKESCRLIILEASGDFVMKLNDYINGTDTVAPNLSFDGRVQFYNYTEENFSLLAWLKEYNKKVDRKVIIAGMDIYNDYVTKIKTILYQIGDSSLTALAKKGDYEKLITRASNANSPNSAPGLSQMLIKTVKQFLACNESLLTVGYSIRDSMMFENVKELINQHLQKNESVAVYGHFSHLIKNENSVWFKNLGSLLQREYGKEYSVLALLAGSGSYFDFYDTLSLKPPVTNSIEHLLSKQSSNDFIIKSSDLGELANQNLLVRSFGAGQDQRQFHPISSVINNMDAILFIQNSTPLQVRFDKQQFKPEGQVSNRQPEQAPFKKEIDLDSYQRGADSKITLQDGIYGVGGNSVYYYSSQDTSSKIYINTSSFIPLDPTSLKLTLLANKNWELNFQLSEDQLEQMNIMRNISRQVCIIINGVIVAKSKIHGPPSNKMKVGGFNETVYNNLNQYLQAKHKK